jgi:hypothetical protein
MPDHALASTRPVSPAPPAVRSPVADPVGVMLNRSGRVSMLVAQRAALNSSGTPLQFSGRGEGGKKKGKSGGPAEIVTSYKTYVQTNESDEDILAAVLALLGEGKKLKKGHGSADSTQGRNAATDQTNGWISAKLREMKADARQAKSRKGQRGKKKYDVDEPADTEAPDVPFRKDGRDDRDRGGGGDGITA